MSHDTMHFVRRLRCRQHAASLAGKRVHGPAPPSQVISHCREAAITVACQDGHRCGTQPQTPIPEPQGRFATKAALTIPQTTLTQGTIPLATAQAVAIPQALAVSAF